MRVHILSDTPAMISSLRTLLEPPFEVTAALLGQRQSELRPPDAILISANLHDVGKISVIRSAIAPFGHLRKLFLLNERSRRAVVQAYALGATKVLADTIERRRLIAELVDQEAILSSDLASPPASVQAGATALNAMFSAAIAGRHIDVAAVEAAGSEVVDSIAAHGLADWLSAVRRHHEGTYQHCLLVTGLAVDFGLSLGMRHRDIRRLYSAAMFHDIGKSKIPLTILDKPSSLNADERTQIETHPQIGFEILSGNPGISAETLDAVQHHHEFLDGSGYPHGLAGNSISDIVRMLTIADVFAALIERRTYKDPLPREGAYDIICAMKGKLEGSLLKAFKSVALHR